MEKELFEKYLKGNCSAEEFEQIDRWIEKNSFTASEERMLKELWDDFEADPEKIEHQKYNRILDRIHHRINISKRPDKSEVPHLSRILLIGTIAAEILLIPVLIIFLYSFFSNREQETADISELEISAPPGSKVYFSLNDGTKVWLNHGSKLKYPNHFKGKDRRVFLTGEAYFQVAKIDNVPFIVGTTQLDIIATGTAFDVSAYPEDRIIETTLVEGRIIVCNTNTTNELKALSPDESLKFNKETTIYSVETGNTVKNTSWKDGFLVFRNDPLEEVAKKLARWYNVDFAIADEKVKDFTFTATFTDENLEQVLELMTLPTPVRYELIPTKKMIDGNYLKPKVIIMLKKNYKTDKEMPMKK